MSLHCALGYEKTLTDLTVREAVTHRLCDLKFTIGQQVRTTSERIQVGSTQNPESSAKRFVVGQCHDIPHERA